MSKPSDPERRLARTVQELAWTGTKMALKRAEQARRRGVDAVGLNGSPRVAPPPHVVEAAARAARASVYAPSNGLPDLRQAIAAHVDERHRVSVDPETEVLVTVGGKHALYVVMKALLDPGDEVLMPAPTYNFHGTVQLLGATPVFAPTYEETGFRWDVDALADRVSPRTKLLVVSSPGNPTGLVADRSLLEQVAELAERHDLLVLSDESFERLVYDGYEHISFASLPGMRDRTITVQSFTKSYAMPAWRIGYVVAPAPLLAAFRKVLEWMVLSCSSIDQAAALAALTGPQDWLDAAVRRHQASRDHIGAVLERIPGLSFVWPRGGGSFFLNVSRSGVTPEQASHHLLEVAGIPTVPGHVFVSDAHVRLNFGGTDEAVAKVCERLPAAFAAMRPARA